MKSLIKAVALTVALAAPLASFAQSNQPLTRAQVRAELIQVEKAGYNPATANPYDYPANIQAAEARIAAQTPAANTSGYGPSSSGTSQSGNRTYGAASSYSPPVVYMGH